MSNLIPWNPMGEIAAMQDTIDRFFNTAWSNTGVTRNGILLALDLHETDKAYTLVANLPGVDAENIDISVHENVLSITAEIKQEAENEDDKVLVRERAYGRFSRQLTLPRDINVDAIETSFENGVLTLTLPKAEAAQRRRIPVHVPNLLKGQNN